MPPRPSPDGLHVVHGVGGSFANLDNVAFSRGGTGGFINNTLSAFANGDDNWIVSVHDRVSGKILGRAYSLYGFPDTDAQFIYAGGGHVASWVGGQGRLPGLRASTGFNFTGGFQAPHAALLGMGPDAAICYKPEYQSGGPTNVHELNGEDWQLSVGTPASVQLLGQKRAVFIENGVQTIGIPQPIFEWGDGLWNPQTAFAGGQWWLSCYSAKRGVVVHSFTSLHDAYPVQPKGDGWHCLVAIAPNILRLYIATGAAEQAGQIYARDIDVVANLIRDPWGAGIWISFPRVPIESINSEPVIPDIPAINRSVWLGFFAGNRASTGAWRTDIDPRSLPGNCYLNADDGLVYAKDGTVMAQYTAAEAEGQNINVEIAAARQRHPGLPVIAYWTRQNHTKEVPPADWVGVEAYRGANESVADFERHIANAISRCPKVALIPQCYTSNTNNSADLLSIPPVIARLTIVHPNVVGIFPFSGPGRATGLQDHPEVRPTWDKLASTVQTPPRIIMQPPKVTITEYSPKSGAAPLRVRAVYAAEAGSGPIDKLQWLIRRVGAKDWSLAALNPGDDPDHTYVIKEPGTWEIKLNAVGPGGEWPTGAQRIIQVSSGTVEPPPDQPPPDQPPPDQPPPAPRPTYDQFVQRESVEIANTYFQARHARPSPSDLYHQAWRRLEERWEHAALLADIRGENPASPQPVPLPKRPTYDEFVQKESAEVVAAFVQKHRVQPQPSDLYHNAWRRLAEGWTSASIVADILGVPLPPPPPPAEVTLSKWRQRGKVFIDENDQAVRWIGFSCFKGCELFRIGDMDTLNAIMDRFEEFNILRTWDYVPWPGTGWESSPPDVWIEFLKYCAGRNKHVEITLLTDDNPARIEPARQLVEALKAAGVTNVLIEVGNEPEIHKNIDTGALRSTVENSGFMYCSGDSGESPRWYGNYLTAHTPRDDEWDRKAHDLMEYYAGGGPSSPSDPARRVPCLSDEPKKPQDTGYNVVQYKGHFGTASLLGAGATFHYEGGKFGQLPDENDQRCLEGALMAMKAFPAAAPLGAYSRPSDSTLRTYVVDGAMVRVRPTSLEGVVPGHHVEGDNDGILWLL